MKEEIDLRAALNAVSDVVQNRPRPLRVFDQIYMKSLKISAAAGDSGGDRI